jgi:HSP20 family protein
MFTIAPLTKNQLTRRNPQFNDMYHLMNSFFNDEFFGPNRIDSMMSTSQEFGFDIQETENEYILEADVPGVSREEISIEYKDNYMTIEVSSKKESEETKDKYIRRERSQKMYRRSFSLENIVADHITAKLENGVLTINAPKAEKSDSVVKIEVQ